MNRQQLLAAIERCDREIADAQAEAFKPHSESEHMGILLWECDWASHKIELLEDLARLNNKEREAA
jgi:hypothetical protein